MSSTVEDNLVAPLLAAVKEMRLLAELGKQDNQFHKNDRFTEIIAVANDLVDNKGKLK